MTIGSRAVLPVQNDAASAVLRADAGQAETALAAARRSLGEATTSVGGPVLLRLVAPFGKRGG